MVVVVVVVLVLARRALPPLVFVFFVGGPTRDRLVPVLEAGREGGGGGRDEFSGSSSGLEEGLDRARALPFRLARVRGGRLLRDTFAGTSSSSSSSDGGKMGMWTGISTIGRTRAETGVEVDEVEGPGRA